MSRYIKQYVEAAGVARPEYGYATPPVNNAERSPEEQAEYQALLNKLVEKPFDELTEAEWKMLEDWE